MYTIRLKGIFYSLFCVVDGFKGTFELNTCIFAFMSATNKCVFVTQFDCERSNTMPFKNMFHFVAFVVCIFHPLSLHRCLAALFYFDVSSVSFDKQLTWIKKWVLLLYKFVSKPTQTHGHTLIFRRLLWLREHKCTINILCVEVCEWWTTGKSHYRLQWTEAMVV